MNSPGWLNKLERRFGRYAVPGLMNIMITGMVVVFIMDAIVCPASGKVPLSYFINFSRSAIADGQVWRIISFVFSPITSRPLFMIFTFYFYWLIGQVMENHWGTFRFNVYYFCGVIGTIIGGFITGYTTNYYLTMSLFIAFAMIAPNMELMLFFFIPVKIKYLAMLDAALLLVSFFMSDVSGKVAIVVSLINLIIFFGGDFISTARMRIHHLKHKISRRK